MGELSAQVAATLAARFAHDYAGGGDRTARFAIVPALAQVLDAAARLVASTGLRAYDGVQLATAIAARGADPDVDAFACFDRDLRHAASVHGFVLHPATM